MSFCVQLVRDWYPDLQTKTYFVPPLYFNRVACNVETIADQKVLVPTEAPSEGKDGRGCKRKHDGSSSTRPEQHAPPSSMWCEESVSSIQVYDCDVREDQAIQSVLQYLRQIAESENEVMVVITQLKFGNAKPSSSGKEAGGTKLQANDRRGECDVLIINKRYGLIVGEVKAVRGDTTRQPSTHDDPVAKRVKKAIKQLAKEQKVLEHLVKDLTSIPITKTLMLPNVTSSDLQYTLRTNQELLRNLRQCLGIPDGAGGIAAVADRCLCEDSMTSNNWWKRTVDAIQSEGRMAPETYEQLVAKFTCEATTVDVLTVTPPRLDMRTQSDAIAQTGLKMARLMLHPKQIELVKQTTPPSVFLIGPPGTGKSVVLAMKGLVWRKERRHVHLISSHSDSRAANILLKHQLVRSLDEDGSMVHLHMFDFGNATELETSVEKLSAAARHGSLYLIADEASGFGFDTFCSKLKQRVPDLHLWAAAMQQDNIPEFFSVERLTVPLRNPPAVLREVERSRFIVNGDVDGYTSSAIPAPTDGLQIHWIRHKGEAGHKEGPPQYCEQCGKDIAVELKGLGVPGEKLRYRDVFVLCDYPSDDLPFVKAMNVPVQALPVWGDEDAIEDVALAKSDQVTVTEWRTVSGLERKVVIGMGPVSGDIELGSRLSSMSRCLAKLIWIESD